MVISIDHGNKQIKTVHKVFVSGLVESDVRPAVGENYILYNSRYYSLTEHRLPYRRDKSKDESFFLLTLFGVAYELLATDTYDPGHTASVDLLIGLPPAHYGAQYDRTVLLCKPIRIEAGAWIGAGATILPGVRIGKHAVVGACSVVTHDAGHSAVVVGSPARGSRTLDPAKFAD